MIAWPADFGQRFTVFVDTEEEFDWSAPLSRHARGTTAAAAIPAAAARFAAAGVPLTYLVDYPIVSDPAAVEHLRLALSDGRSAIGAQLHPWVNPPYRDHEETSYAGNLPVDLEAAKLDHLTSAIATAFGQRPIIYRAGRYGLGADTLAALAKRGYRIDSSMRSRYDYRADGGPDYRAVGNHAFRAGPGNAIVELPLTTIFTGHVRNVGPALEAMAARLPFAPGLLARAGLLARVALTPEEMPVRDVLEAVRVTAGEGLALLNFSFHSPSLAPGHTPYVRDAADLAAFWRWWDAVLDLLAKLNIRAAALSEIDRATRLA